MDAPEDLSGEFDPWLLSLPTTHLGPEGVRVVQDSVVRRRGWEEVDRVHRKVRVGGGGGGVWTGRLILECPMYTRGYVSVRPMCVGAMYPCVPYVYVCVFLRLTHTRVCVCRVLVGIWT